jgi:hypothetical protein
MLGSHDAPTHHGPNFHIEFPEGAFLGISRHVSQQGRTSTREVDGTSISAVFLSAAICASSGPGQAADKASLTETSQTRCYVGRPVNLLARLHA